MDREKSQKKRAFVAGPFSQALAGHSFHQGLQLRLETLGRVLREDGFQVFSSHEREDWGHELDKPAQLADIDLVELMRSDVLLVYVGDVPSIGIWIEIGVAVSLAKRVIVVTDPTAPAVVSSFFDGLVELGKLQRIEWASDDWLAKELDKLL